MIDQNHESHSPASVRSASLHDLPRSLDAVDRELDRVGANVRSPRRDVPLDLASLDALLSSIASPSMVLTSLSVPTASPVETTPSGAPPLSIGPLSAPIVHATPVALSTPAHNGVQPSSGLALPAGPQASPAPSSTDDEEDIPRRFFDLDATTGDALATILDVPDFLASETLASGAPQTLLSPPRAASPPVAQSSLQLLDDPTFLTEPLALPATDLLFDATPEFLTAALDPAPSVPPAPLLIDEDDVVLEAAASTPPAIVPEQARIEAHSLTLAEAPSSATGTLLGVSVMPLRSIAPSPRRSESDSGGPAFKLEPELNDAPMSLASQSFGVSDRLGGGEPMAPSARTLPRASGRTHNPPALPSQPPSRTSSPSLRAAGSGRQPPPPPRQAHTAPPPARRTGGAPTTEDVEELDAQEVEIVGTPSVPPPAAQPKAPTSAAERLPGQK